MTDFDADDFRAPAEIDISQLPKGRLRHRGGQLFIKGPIPWDWILRAGRLPGKTLHVAIVLWQLAGLKRARTFKLNLRTMPWMTRAAARRGLRALANAGLVEIAYKPGQTIEVTLLEARDDE